MYESLTERIIGFCENPLNAQFKDGFNKLVFGSKVSAMLGAPVVEYDFNCDRVEKNIESMKDKTNYVLYSGGKESLLTCKILDFYGVEYKKVLFDESVKSFSDNIYAEADIILGSEVIEEYGNDLYGKHIPLIAYYSSVLADLFPHSVIWIGAANVDEKIRFSLGNSDHSDLSMYLSSRNTECEFYSCVNSLSEFDIYRIMKNCFDYEDIRSCGDNPEKGNRITAFSLANDLYATLADIDERERLMMFDSQMLLNGFIGLKKPTMFDFRSDLRLFLSSMDDLNVGAVV